MAVFRDANAFLSNMATVQEDGNIVVKALPDNPLTMVYFEGKDQEEREFTSVETAFQAVKCWLASRKNDKVLDYFSNIDNPFVAKKEGRNAKNTPYFSEIKEEWDDSVAATVLAELIHRKFMDEDLAQKLISFTEGDEDTWSAGCLYYKQIQEEPIPDGKGGYINNDYVYGTGENKTGKNITGKLLTEERTYLRCENNQENSNILTVSAKVYVNANNCAQTAAIVDTDIALTLRGGYPYNFDVFQKRHALTPLKPGDIMPIEGTVKDYPTIIYTGIKDGSYKTKVEWIESILQKLMEYLKSVGYPTVAIPLLGTVADGLNPETVKALILKYFAGYPNKYWVDGKWYDKGAVASVDIANTDDVTASGTGIPAEASKEATKMLTLKNKAQILEKLGQKPIEPQAAVKDGKIVACGKGLTEGFVADGEFVAPRLGVMPQVVAALDDVAASYTFDGKKIIVSDISKATAAYTGAVEVDPAAATASTVKKFVGTTFKEVISGGLTQTENEIQKKVSTEREIYSVETLSGFSFAGFLSGDEDGFELSLKAAAEWLATAVKTGNVDDKLVVKFVGNTPTTPANNPAPSESSDIEFEFVEDNPDGDGDEDRRELSGGFRAENKFLETSEATELNVTLPPTAEQNNDKIQLDLGVFDGVKIKVIQSTSTTNPEPQSESSLPLNSSIDGLGSTTTAPTAPAVSATYTAEAMAEAEKLWPINRDLGTDSKIAQKEAEQKIIAAWLTQLGIDAEAFKTAFSVNGYMTQFSTWTLRKSGTFTVSARKRQGSRETLTLQRNGAQLTPVNC